MSLIHAPHWANAKVSLCLRLNPSRILRPEEQATESITCERCIYEIPRAAMREIRIAEGHPPDCTCSYACSVTPEERAKIARAIEAAEGR